MKKTIEQLDEMMCSQFGKKFCAVYDGENKDTFIVEVIEGYEDVTKIIIEESGYEILGETWFSGSEWNGTAFTIR